MGLKSEHKYTAAHGVGIAGQAANTEAKAAVDAKDWQAKNQESPSAKADRLSKNADHLSNVTRDGFNTASWHGRAEAAHSEAKEAHAQAGNHEAAEKHRQAAQQHAAEKIKASGGGVYVRKRDDHGRFA